MAEDEAALWRRIPGDKARRYANVETGEVISRTVYDKRYGRLAKQGFSHPRQQAAANAKRDRAAQLARPAPGRIVKPSVAASRLKPITNKMGRYMSMPFRIFLTDNEEENLIQAWPYKSEYDAIIAGVIKNKNFDWVMFEVKVEDMHPVPITGPLGISYQILKDSLPDFKTFVHILYLEAKKNDSLGLNIWTERIVFYLHVEKTKRVFDDKLYVLKKKKNKIQYFAKKKPRKKKARK